MASSALQALPKGRSWPPNVKFWEDFVLYGMPGRDLISYYTQCSPEQYWDMNAFLMTQLLTTVNCCGRCIWAFIRVVQPSTHQPGCDCTNMASALQQTLVLAFPWMETKLETEFWQVHILPGYIKAQARCLENKWLEIDKLLNPDRKEVTFRFSYGLDARKPNYSTYVTLLELLKGGLPTANPDGTLQLKTVSVSAILSRMPYNAGGQLHYVDPFWNLIPVSTDDHIRRAVQADYDNGHDVFFLHVVPLNQNVSY